MTADGQPTRRKIQVGEYKEHANSVRLQNGEIFHYASVIETPMKMQELMSWYNQQKTVLHPVQLAAEFHHKFVLIHPFDDGNGRIARLIVNYMLLRRGYPPIIIKSVDKKNYLLALDKADTGDLAAFIIYIGDQLAWTLDLYISAAKGEAIEEDGDWNKKLELLKKDPSTIVKRNEKNTIFFLKTVYSETISKLNKRLFDTFRDVFIQNHYWTVSSNNTTRLIHLFVSDTDLRSRLIEHRIINYKSVPTIITNFQFNDYRKNGFKSFDVNLKLNLKFEKYGYRIHLEKEPIIFQGIEKPITADQLNNLFDKMGRLLMVKIENSLEVIG